MAIRTSIFRVLFLRRLRMSLPLGPRRCSCHGALSAYGDHRASQALPLERALSPSLPGSRSAGREFDPSAAAVLDSQAGLFAARIFTSSLLPPYCHWHLHTSECGASGCLCRALRRTVAADVARTPGHLSTPRHPRCKPSSVLRASNAPLQRAAARVCREAGAIVATNVLVRDLSLPAR